MIDPSKRRGAFAGVVALTAILSIVPALAQTTPPAPPAAASAAPSATPTPAKPPAKPASRRTYGVDARIKSLHARLHITAAQEPQWQQVAQAMRDNAASIDKMVRERNAKLRTMTAVENLQTYANIADAHADGLKKLVPAFDNLYQSMSAAQKKDADAVFRGIAEHYAHRAAPKTAKPAAPAQK